MYIGLKKIKDEVIKDGLVFVTFEDTKVDDTISPGGTDILSVEMYEASITEDPLDLSTLRNKQITPIVAEILKTILKWNIHFVNDWDLIDSMIRSGLNEHKKYADEKLWGKDRSQIRLLDIDQVKKEGKPHGRDNFID